MFGRKRREAELKEQMARIRETRMSDNMRRAELMQRELATFEDDHANRLMHWSKPLDVQIRVALELGAPFYVAEIYERVVKGAVRHLRFGDWVLGATFRPRQTIRDNGFSSPPLWALVIDRGFVLCVGSTSFFATPEEALVQVDLKISVSDDGPNPYCHWVINSGSFYLSNYSGFHPLLAENTVAAGILLQQQLLKRSRGLPLL